MNDQFFVYDENSVTNWNVCEDTGETTAATVETTCSHPDTKVGTPGKEATCKEAGYTAEIVCTVCGAVTEKSQPEAKKAHTWKNADCENPKTCSVCGTTEGISLGHNYVGGVCTQCGDPEPKASTTSDNSGGSEEPPTNEEAESASEGGNDSLGEGNIDVSQNKKSTPAETEGTGETMETTGYAGDPDGGTGFHLCNPFSCGCWIYILIALLVGLIAGYVMGVRKKKKKQSKRRSRPYTEVDLDAANMPIVTTAAVPVATVADSVGSGVTAAVHQHIGARKDQQDSYGVSDLNAYATNGVLAVVADGMGGLANGAAVSSTLVHTLLNYYRQTTGRESVADMMLDMVTQSNDQINRMLQGADRSGSTLVSAVVREGKLYFLTVGDSRIYLYRGGKLLQLNREHIYQEELALKAINHIVPLQQVTGDRQAHALTSYLGIGRLTHIDRNYEGIKLEPGDRLLLASDGVFGTLSQADMEAALQGSIGEATDVIGEKILQAAMPYQDNNTALVLEYHG